VTPRKPDASESAEPVFDEAMFSQSAALLSRRAVLLAGLGSGAAFLAACTTSSDGAPQSARTPIAPRSSSLAPSAPASSSSAPASPSSAPSSRHKSSKLPKPRRATGDPVHVSSFLGDGELVGVGMPIVLSFSPTPTDARSFVKAARVTVNGRAVRGAWYWEKPYADQPVQAHFRMRDYWPANSTVRLELPIGGLSAGKGPVFTDALNSVTFRTGDKRVTTVNGATERAIVRVNDKHHRTMRASLGKSATPTTTGTKLVMQKGEFVPGTHRMRPDGAVRMQNTAHTYDLMVDWSVRITTSGEYLHAAPWNSQIGHISTSDGCTNLSVADAKWFYHFCRIGDVVIHEHTGGDPVRVTDGFGDWNLPWAQWQAGGLLPPT
jgi:lipoprotein-anchoring transpeptidase ErfK/SrfK